MESKHKKNRGKNTWNGHTGLLPEDEIIKLQNKPKTKTNKKTTPKQTKQPTNQTKNKTGETLEKLLKESLQHISGGTLT